MDIIEISNMRLRAFIGFSQHELNARQDLVISLRIGLARGLAGESDDPDDALNYKLISKAVIRLVSGSRFALLEKLSEEIARLVIVDFNAIYVSVSAQKPGALRGSDAVGLVIERRPADYDSNIAYLSLGSNIAPRDNLPAAVQLLRRRTTLLAVSPVYRSAPQGFAHQPPFFNLAVKARTQRSPLDFKTRVIDRIESELGRVRDPGNVNAPRTIDIDICLWNQQALVYGDKPWHIPDPDILRYAHVALPLADLAGVDLHPTAGRTLAQISQDFDLSALERVELDLGGWDP